ncbi:restriction endonuclease subunit S, partial [Shewanella morhuae]|uniref:restriction endonuclease subunit S n=1 Tax=Shewanella morhuae TaxID=365591 RepID=UPI001C7E02E2
REKIIATVIALPPQEEQQRIVAKVDELMSLCDALEAQTEASISAHQTLVETLLNALLLPQTAANTASQSNVSLERPFTNSFVKDWQRVAEHFDTLFTTAASIDTLKQTILQLAVMGKLVKQDPNDEPAAKLLERIAKEKVQLIKEGKIKKQKPLPAITEEEKSFELPQGWEWIRLEDLVDIQGGITKGRKLIGRELITVKYLSVANVQRSYLDLGHLKEIEIPVEEEDKYRVKARDLLITEGGDWDKVGRTAIWSNELPYIAHQNHVFKARIFLEEQSEVWLEKYLNGPFARDYFAGSSKQTTNLASINKTQLRGCLIAIPPNEEKDRIVTKVDELMALCDQLKVRLADAQTTQLYLTDAIVEQAI